MIYKRLLATFSFLVLIVSPSLANEKETVTLPLETYREYLKLKERPPVTTLESVAIVGTMAGANLTLKIAGRSSQEAIAKEFLTLPETVRLMKCSGNALIYRTNASYSLLPKSETIEATCRIKFREMESLRLVFGSSVLDVRVDVKDADVVEEPIRGERFAVALSRKAEPSPFRVVKKGKVVVRPRYRITVTSDERRFSYHLSFDNPNPQTKVETVPLVNGEILSKVNTTVANQWDDKKLELSLRPGKTNVTITGQLPQAAFVPLFESEEQYLLLEFHPLVALKLTKEPPRIALEQVGLSASYQAAIGFLIGKGKELAWEAKTRQVFPSASFAAIQSRHLIYVPQRDEPLVDASWQFRNQGKPSLQIGLPGPAIFAAANDVPQVLAKTDDNELYLPLRTGESNLRVQYKLEAKPPRIFGRMIAPLAKPQAALPSAHVELRFDTRQHIVSASLLDRIQVPWFNTRAATWAFLVALLWLLAIRHFGITRPLISLASAGGLFVAGTICSSVASFSLLTMAAVYLYRYHRCIWEWIQSQLAGARSWQKVLIGLLGGGFVVVVGVLILASLTTMTMRANRGASDSYSYDEAPSAPMKQKSMNMRGGMAKPGMDREEMAVMEENIRVEESYLGLPVEQVIPGSGKRLYFNLSSIPKDLPMTLRIYVLGHWTAVLLSFLVLIGWLGPLVLERRTLGRSFREGKKS